MLTGLTAHLESKYPGYNFAAFSTELKRSIFPGRYAFEIIVGNSFGEISEEDRGKIMSELREYLPWKNLAYLSGLLPMRYISESENTAEYRDTVILLSIPDEEFNLLIQKDLFL